MGYSECFEQKQFLFSMTDLSVIADEIDSNNKNKRLVRCQFCNSLILRESSADFVKKEVLNRFFQNHNIPVFTFY
jgi:hypothetical protein